MKNKKSFENVILSESEGSLPLLQETLRSRSLRVTHCICAKFYINIGLFPRK